MIPKHQKAPTTVSMDPELSVNAAYGISTTSYSYSNHHEQGSVSKAPTTVSMDPELSVNDAYGISTTRNYHELSSVSKIRPSAEQVSI